MVVWRVLESDDDFFFVEGLGFFGKYVNYGVIGFEECFKIKFDVVDKVVIDSVFREVIEVGWFFIKYEVRVKMCEDSYLRKYVM